MAHLTGPYSYAPLDDEAFWPLVEAHRAAVFSGTSMIDPQRFYSDSERAALGPLRKNLANSYSLKLGIFHGGDFVGWHFSHQTDPDAVYMTNTGILAEHRRRGLYTALLPVVLETFRQEGFQIVSSRHTATNNAVIIPKLKAGFVITGLELDDRFGTLVKLAYYFNPGRRKLIDVRSGQQTLESDTQNLLG